LEMLGFVEFCMCGFLSFLFVFWRVGVWVGLCGLLCLVYR
jgi:hypothetical protein